MAQKKKCPNCGKQTGVRLLYGLPGGEMIEQAERGEIILGGCCLAGADPDWKCTSCHHAWR
jgi:hypothetical protein